MNASIVICTYRGDFKLGEVLTALHPQLPSSAEVVLVRSGAAEDESLPHEVESWIEHAPCPTTVVRTPQLGVARARNAGVAAAAYDVVLFLDDDALPLPGWFDNLVQAMADPDIGVAAGSIVPRWPNGGPPDWVSRNISVGYFGAREAGRTRVPPFGANMAIRRSAVLAVGGFRTELGTLGSKPGAHEEAELSRRLTDAGFGLAEVPLAVVEHIVRPEQLRFSWILRRAWRIGMSDAIQDSIRGTLRPKKRSKRLLKAPAKAIRNRGPARVEVVTKALGDLAYLVQIVKS